MDSRRFPRAVNDPIIRQVGFFAPPDRSQQAPPVASPPSPPTPAKSLSPVMIPPPRDFFAHVPRLLVPPIREMAADSSILVGSYNASEFSDMASEEQMSVGGRSVKFAFSLPSGGFDAAEKHHHTFDRSSNVTEVAKVGTTPGVTVMGGEDTELKNEEKVRKPTLKEKTTKAERRAKQEAQRAEKTASKGEGARASATAKTVKPAKAVAQKKEGFSAAATEKKTTDRDKHRKKEAPHPRLQFDDANRVEKAKKRSVVKQTEVKNRVEVFRHLPQYEQGTSLKDLESKFFRLDSVQSSVYKVGLKYLSGAISGGNARCIAMLEAFKDSIKEYSTPPQKSLIRDLTTKINSQISFLIECRRLSFSMGNAIRFLKTRTSQLPSNLSEAEAKGSLISDIERFINEKIVLADKAIVGHAVTKIRDGDVLLTYSCSSSVEMIFLHAHELGKKFRVVIVDSRPRLEGQNLLRRLVSEGIECTYTHINAVSYVMHEVTRVFLGASSVLANGTVYSRVGTACVAMVADQFRVPVLVCCEAYKFHERVQLDSICENELGDPDAISKVSGRDGINFLDGWGECEHLQLLNLLYDATPADYVSMIICDYGMIPPTSVPVIVREYRREQLWIQ